MSIKLSHFFFFFFQAEDGIRDVAVTGVQTCALPILRQAADVDLHALRVADPSDPLGREHVDHPGREAAIRDDRNIPLDRKSTRLNSSHGYISYAVFCLKKKKKNKSKY